MFTKKLVVSYATMSVETRDFAAPYNSGDKTNMASANILVLPTFKYNLFKLRIYMLIKTKKPNRISC